MQPVTQHQTSLGQKMAAQQCCMKESRTTLLTYRDKLLEITHVQLGMEWVNRKMLQLQLLYTVSLRNLLSLSTYMVYVTHYLFDEIIEKHPIISAPPQRSGENADCRLQTADRRLQNTFCDKLSFFRLRPLLM